MTNPDTQVPVVQVDREAPDFTPAREMPVWLSSEDLLRLPYSLSEQGLDKAACWDVSIAIRRLISEKGVSGGRNGS